MAFPIPMFVVQCALFIYNSSKDLFTCIRAEQQDIKDLCDNLRDLIADVMAIEAKKKDIDETLLKSTFKDKNNEYGRVEQKISFIKKKTNKLLTKYQKHTGGSLLPEIDISTEQQIIDEIQERKAKMLTPSFFKLAELSRDISKLKTDVSQFRDRVRLENLLVAREPEAVQVQHVDNHLPQDRYVNDLLKYLSDQNLKRIGITGHFGVGKTTVLTKVNNKLKEMTSLSSGHSSLLLDIVIWINFPENLSTEETIEKIQDKIVERLKLDQERPKSRDQKAAVISSYLHQKKYIVLMDQVSFEIDLNRLGLHEEHKYGKVVIASSNEKVINRLTKPVVKIEKLSPCDAWKYFQNIYGKIEDDRKIIARRIIDCCGGLPRVICIVAKYLKDKKSSWDDVKRILQVDTEPYELVGLEAFVNVYKKVYEELSENYMKKCLLYGALFPSEHIIREDYLIECWMAERFIVMKDSRILSATRARGVSVLKELTDRCLLERCSDNHVTMPKFFRKVALNQNYPGEENSVTWFPWDNEIPSQKIWRKATRMSLISCNPRLPEAPRSCNMSTLLLQRNQELVTIGASFFKHMKKLRVLDLYGTRIESLPCSISSLLNLASLYLNNCPRLLKLPDEVKMLTNLEFLDIRGTSIPCLPDEIGGMSLLRCLRVSFSQDLCICNSAGNNMEVLIPPNILGSLELLEELSIEMGCCCQSRRYNADQIAKELAHLEKLSTLNFHFPSVRSLKKFINDSKSWKNTVGGEENALSSFKIFIGCCEIKHPYGSDISRIFAQRHLRFSTREETSSLKEEISSEEEISLVNEVLRQTGAFELFGHSNVESLTDFDLGTARSLKFCIVGCCKNLLTIVDAVKINEMEMGISPNTPGAGLQSLEELHLFDLQSLQSIWKGSIFAGSLSKLKVLKICGCPQMVEILNLELAKALSSLNHLKVENCFNIVEIVKVEIANGQEIVDLSDTLDKLETIELVNLPQLQGICGSNSMNWKSLMKIVIINCSKLENLSLSNAQRLQKIQCEASWWDAVNLLGGEKQDFLPLCEFIAMEQPLTSGGSHKGESSNSRRSDSPQASDNIDSQTSNVENGLEEIMSSSGCSNDPQGSKTISADGAHRPEGVTPVQEDSLESTTVAQPETGEENPEVQSQFKVGRPTCQPSNIDAPAENEASTISEERSVQNGSVNVH